jgi:hypothetical protein
MRHYRDASTGEIVTFDLAANTWYELRCDSSTAYKVRLLQATVTPEQARALTPITPAEYETYRQQVHEANAAARGEALLKKTHPRTTFMFF